MAEVPGTRCRILPAGFARQQSLRYMLLLLRFLFDVGLLASRPLASKRRINVPDGKSRLTWDGAQVREELLRIVGEA